MHPLHGQPRRASGVAGQVPVSVSVPEVVLERQLHADSGRLLTPVLLTLPGASATVEVWASDSSSPVCRKRVPPQTVTWVDCPLPRSTTASYSVVVITTSGYRHRATIRR